MKLLKVLKKALSYFYNSMVEGFDDYIERLKSRKKFEKWRKDMERRKLLSELVQKVCGRRTTND